ncbi:MAG: signal peptidase I [Patescibacteria group bacterium]
MDKTPEIKAKETKPSKDMSWKSFFLYLVLIILFRVYVIEPHSVSGSSMDNTFHTNDYVLVDKLSYDFSEPKRGDVIVFNPPIKDRTEDRFIKRIIAIPGDSVNVSGAGTFVNGQKLNENYVVFPSNLTASTTLSTDEYFVMGDNRSVSYDSRAWGVLNKEHIQGRVILRLYPFNQIGLFPGSISQQK